MSTEREKEREAELENAMYTNCLLLGLDPAIIGAGSGGARVGNFRHSNPRMGEQLLYFLLSSLRGPVQSAKDFDKVWPIFDSAQSRDFRKIVQGIISDLESQGALPRSNSRVSSLATCCGPRFVELLWQLSVHALREVHKRTFASDVASNPLPSSLTDVSYLHAASLLPVTKARIALERRKFLKNAHAAVQRQTAWSNLANEMTAEFRGLCAEEAYLQQELEKLEDMRNKVKMEGESWDDRISGSSAHNSHLVSKATRLWESLLARKSQHEVLASGPIEDLIAHREHRYRISGTSLLAAMDLSSSSSAQIDSHEQKDQNEAISRAEDQSGTAQPTVDVAEILRRWTHALQRIHKQSLHLAKANGGEGPELLRCASDSGTSGHAESLAATLAEHRQHLASIQGLINQLKEAVPTMQKSIADLAEEVNNIAPCTIDEYSGRSSSPILAQASGRSLENNSDEVTEMTFKLNSMQLEKASNSPPLKLPHLFNLTPNSSGKTINTPKRHVVSTQPVQSETLAACKPIEPSFTNERSTPQDTNITCSQKLRRSVREAALSKPVNNTKYTGQKSIDDGSEHFFIPLSTGLTNRKKIMPASSPQEVRVNKSLKQQSLNLENDLSSVSHVSMKELNGTAKFETPTNGIDSRGADDCSDQVLSPPLLMDSTFFSDAYEDLLAPLSDIDAALMER